MNQYISTTETAKKLGISRIAVFNRIKSGKLEAIRVGKNYAVPTSALPQANSTTINTQTKQAIDQAVRKTVKEYGKTLKLLGRE